MSETIDAIKPGSVVLLWPDFEVKGMVMQLAIHPGNRVVYEVGWWHLRDYKSQWFPVEMLEVSEEQDPESTVLQIGFRG